MLNTINLNRLDKKSIKEWLESYDTILTDCDAVLWHDAQVIPQVPETINTLQLLGKQIYFVTNNGTKTRHDLWLKARQMNFDIAEDHIIAPTYSIAEFLKHNLKPKELVYVIGSPALSVELNNLNIPNFGTGEDVVEGKWLEMLENIKKESSSKEKVGALVVGFDEHFSLVKMLKASHAIGLNPESFFLATNSDAVHRYPNYSIPGTGAIVKALETCLDRKAEVMGKPNPLICEQLIKSGKIKPERTLMIGDCAKTDVLFGKKCGFQTLMVGTGSYKWPQVEELMRQSEANFIPNYYIESLGDLEQYIK